MVDVHGPQLAAETAGTKDAPLALVAKAILGQRVELIADFRCSLDAAKGAAS